MLAYRLPIVCSLLALCLPFFAFGWLAECFRAVSMLLIACRSACRMLAAFILFAEFADSVACRTAHCQHAVVRVAIMLSASRLRSAWHAMARYVHGGSDQHACLLLALCLSTGTLFSAHTVFL